MEINTTETKTKTPKTKVSKTLNRETAKVLGVIVKNAGFTATKIQKKLRWAFIPTRALGFLRKNKFVIVGKADKGYTVSAAGSEAVTNYVPGKRTVKKVTAKKTRKATPAPIVPAEPEMAPAVVEAAAPVLA